MKQIQIAENTWKIGSNLGNEELFEGIWPTPDGVSVNSYFIREEKSVLIDIIKKGEEFINEYEEELNAVDASLKTVDYLIINHMEPDHTGALLKLTRFNPNVRIFCTKKSVPMLKAFYGIEKNVTAVSDGETLDLGNGRVLTFLETPNIHWPETMMTYDSKNQILFSCDAFGSFKALPEGKTFDDEMNEQEMNEFQAETLRYYSNIVSTFTPFVVNGLKKLASLKIKVIAPSHGMVWRKNPETIVNWYQKLCDFAVRGDRRITVIWSSMYGNTEAMLKTVIDTLNEVGIPYSVYRIPDEPKLSYVLADCWRSEGIILGMPTYEYRMFPPMAHVIDLLDRSHIKNRLAFRFGSFGWSGGAQKQLDELTAKLNWTFLNPVEFQGAPKEEDKAKAAAEIREMANRINAGRGNDSPLKDGAVF